MDTTTKLRLLAGGKGISSNVKHRLTSVLRRGDVPDLTANPALAEKELGFKATQDLDTMCRDLWNWQSKNPEGYA